MRNSLRLSDGDVAQRRLENRPSFAHWIGAVRQPRTSLPYSRPSRVHPVRLKRAPSSPGSVDGLLSGPGGACDAMLATAWPRMVRTAPMSRALAPAVYAAAAFAMAISLRHKVGLLLILDMILTLRNTNRRAVSLPDGWLVLPIRELHEPHNAVTAHRWGLGIDAADAIGTHPRRDLPAVRHPLAETLLVAEHLVDATVRDEPLDLSGRGELGERTGDPIHVRRILDRQLAKV